MSPPSTSSQRQLLELLPEVYRTRDNGDLAGYLAACGGLLDRVRATLSQRLADVFPDHPDSQEWLLPYVAELLDVRLVSPSIAGRRDEVSHAVAWRQRVGTLAALEQIAESVLRTEVEPHEGLARVAVTPRIGAPPPPVTVDVRRSSRSVRASAGDATARTSSFGAAGRVRWRQANPSGAPCFPGSYEDVSRRTVDVRAPSWRGGHQHPKRVLLHAAPPLGYFAFTPAVVAWADRADPAHADVLAVDEDADSVTVRGLTEGLVVLTGSDGTLALDEAKHYHLEGVMTTDELVVAEGTLTARRAAAPVVRVGSSALDAPVLDARDCLFETLDAGGLVRLEHCTLRAALRCAVLQASDCLFSGALELDGPATPRSCARYCRLPPGLDAGTAGRLSRHATTTDAPVFVDFVACDAQQQPRRAAELGQPGYGVLHVASPPSIRFGAEDGGELGAYHARQHCLAEQAVLDKLADFLPVGVEAALIPDPRLLSPPPAPVQ